MWRAVQAEGEEMLQWPVEAWVSAIEPGNFEAAVKALGGLLAWGVGKGKGDGRVAYFRRGVTGSAVVPMKRMGWAGFAPDSGGVSIKHHDDLFSASIGSEVK